MPSSPRRSALPLGHISQSKIPLPPVRPLRSGSRPTSPAAPIATTAAPTPSPYPTPSSDSHIAALTAQVAALTSALSQLAVPVPQALLPHVCMPFRGDPVAPVFSGDDRDLLRFLGDVCMLGEAVGLSGAELIRWATYYASEDDAELWAGLPESAGGDWLVFRSAVIQLYPGVSEDRRYAFADLESLLEQRSRQSIESKAELGEFHRSFLRVSNFLFKRGRLGTDEACRMYLGAFSGNFRDRLDDWLSRRFLHKHPEDPYPINDVYKTALFVLDFPPVSAAPSASPAPPPFQSPPRAADAPLVPPLSPLLSPPSPPSSQTCLFCSDPSHFIRRCPVKQEYLESGRCIMGSDGRIRMPDGRLVPRAEGLVGLKERLDAQAKLMMDEMKVVGVLGASSVLLSLGCSISPSCPHSQCPLSHSIPLPKSLP